MKWSLKVGRFAETVVYVHITFFVLLAWIGIADGLEKKSVAAAAAAIAFTITLFACVALHEFGHALMAQRFGIRTRDITLFPIGGVGRLERIPDVPSQEFLIAIAGPAVSAGIAALLFAAIGLQGPVAQAGELASANVSFVERLLFINAGLAMFNLLPAFPMDGGRVLRALLAMRLDYLVATEVAARIGQAIAVLFAVVGGLMPHPALVIIALFVWVGAAGEAGVARVRRSLRGRRVETALRSAFAALAPGDSLGHAAEMSLRHGQPDLPVLANGQVVGLLNRADLLAGLSAGGAARTAAECMHRTFETVEGCEALDVIFNRCHQEGDRTLLVTNHGRLVGLVSLDQITNLLRLEGAIGRRHARATSAQRSIALHAGMHR